MARPRRPLDAAGRLRLGGVARCGGAPLPSSPTKTTCEERARRLIEESIASNIEIYEPTTEDYIEAIDRVVDVGSSSGAVYDAIHVVAAQRTKCDRILTYNVRHLTTLASGNNLVATP